MRVRKPSRRFERTVKAITKAQAPRYSFRAKVKDMEPEEMATRALELDRQRDKADLDIYSLSEYYYLLNQYQQLTGRPLIKYNWVNHGSIQKII